MSQTKTVDLLGVPFTPVTMDDVFSELESCLSRRRGAYVCAVCATTIVDASKDAVLMRALTEADINLPDGAPVAWAISRLTGHSQSRLAGPNVMLDVLAYMDPRAQRVVLYGSTETVLKQLSDRIGVEYPGVVIAAAISPPFHELAPEEDEAFCERIRASRPAVVLVGLGEPKQEKWMHAHCADLNSLLIGVGAAFEYNAGLMRRAPTWVQDAGFEWLYRLVHQPRRTGSRFARTLPVFAWRLGLQLSHQVIRNILQR